MVKLFEVSFQIADEFWQTAH